MIARKLYLAFLFVCALLPLVDAAFPRRQNKTTIQHERVHEDDMPQVHSLVEVIGKEIYTQVNTPKYKFYIYMTIGTLPDEKSTIALLSSVCNILYCFSILLGFLFFRRIPMLIFAVLTFAIGPVLVLVLLGTLGLCLAAFALYPMSSVFCMILWFFLTSKMAQTLGLRFGLDSDQDGDVDWLDVLHFISQTKIGQSLQLERLHAFLNQCKRDPFKEIHHQLDRIHRVTKLNAELISDTNVKTSFISDTSNRERTSSFKKIDERAVSGKLPPSVYVRGIWVPHD